VPSTSWCRPPPRRPFAACSRPARCNNPASEPAPVSIEGSRRTSEPRRAGPIDIIFLVERLESLIANGKKLPLTNNVVVDQVGALDLIDQLRVAVPEEVRAAKRINSEGDRIIDKAQEEAEQIVARAQEQAAFLIEERGLLEAAQEESRRILERSDEEAAEVRRGADEYAASVLIGLEGDVVRTLQSIKKGIQLLDERRASLRSTEADTDEDEAPDAAREVAPARGRS
jgi:hypothetical protein